MNSNAIAKLEFNKILDALSSHASSAEAKRKCLETAPLDDIHLIEKRQQENADALARIFRDGSISFSGTHDIRRTVSEANHSFTLGAIELMDIAATLEPCSRIKSYGDIETTADSLSELFSCLAPLAKTSAEIRRCIISEDEVADDASAKLKSIRRNIVNWKHSPNLVEIWIRLPH